VARAHQLFGVGPHERGGHGHLTAVRQDEARAAGAEVLDQGEDVVPAAGVQAGGVVAQLVQDFFHLEGRGDGFDQHRGADGALRDAEQVLGQDEDVVPEPGFEVVLDLGQVEVRTLALREQAAGVVEEVQAEVHDAPGDGFAVDQHVLLGQVPAAGPDHDGGQLLGGLELVFLAFRRREVDPALQRVREVQLALDDVAPRRRGGVFHVRQPNLGAGVQGVDGHLLVHRASDLHAAVLQTGCRGSHAPVRIVPDGLGFPQEPRILAPGDVVPPGPPSPEQFLAPPGSRLVQLCNEGQSVRREHLALPANRLRSQSNPIDGEVVGEAVHFKSLLRRSKLTAVRRLVLGGAEKGNPPRAIPHARQGPRRARPSRGMGRTLPDHLFSARGMGTRVPAAVVPSVSDVDSSPLGWLGTSGTGLLRWIPPRPGWMRSG
jgi:hypothetical protein